ncbi:oligoribonuclease [Thiomicrospira cyclica]|uniref:Oligoribonuclease n=1 Tax=Thiomicrospira cyclica (strain DSM 14477 / JCM 11371 / ALM1) TaxID=717773 RepID=F6D9Y7_THICA|nr:oligoribonuclease [Thiomicrospira cyclica]AEG31024.1 Oligoribonuclease [Thiomicrospira cyclica ALM1]
MKSDTNLVWIDLEMTGLEPGFHKTIEIATVVTDANLNLLAEGPVMAIATPEAELAKMDAWCQKTHGASGLTARVQASKVTLAEAEQATVEFLSQFVSKGQSPMCGNSICQDRRFLAVDMPNLEAYFHYRNLDVSSIKELAKRWYPSIYSGFKKKNAHLALDDIYESIAELRYYREQLFPKA